MELKNANGAGLVRFKVRYKKSLNEQSLSIFFFLFQVFGSCYNIYYLGMGTP